MTLLTNEPFNFAWIGLLQMASRSLGFEEP